jgi:hypothetical protein
MEDRWKIDGREEGVKKEIRVLFLSYILFNILSYILYYILYIYLIFNAYI